MANTWLNSDGLYVKFGRAQGTSPSPGGMYCTYEKSEQVYEWDITLANLTEAETIQNDVLALPNACMITKVEVQTLVAGQTGVAIDVGLIAISRNTSDAAFSADPIALLTAFPIANMGTGEVSEFRRGSAGLFSIVSGDAFGGSKIGTVTAVATLLTCSRTTATAFTAGRCLIRVTVLPKALA